MRLIGTVRAVAHTAPNPAVWATVVCLNQIAAAWAQFSVASPRGRYFVSAGTTSWGAMWGTMGGWPLGQHVQVWNGARWVWLHLDPQMESLIHTHATMGTPDPNAEHQPPECTVTITLTCPVCEGSREEILFFTRRACQTCAATGVVTDEQYRREMDGRRG